MNDSMRAILDESQAVTSEAYESPRFVDSLVAAAHVLIAAFSSGGRVLFCGNGGSAADAQHFAAELSGRFRIERPPLPAEALHANTSFLTAVANDYGYDEVFARGVRAVGKPGDVLVAISTSGRSVSIINACAAAREIGMKVVFMTGSGDHVPVRGDVVVAVPSVSTPRVQEVHVVALHAIAQTVEQQLFGHESAS